VYPTCITVLHKAVNKTKSRRLRWARRAACIDKPLNSCGVLAGNLKEQDSSDVLGIEDRG